MKSKDLFFIPLLTFLLIACCKQTPVPQNTLIGEWKIVRIDSTKIWDPKTKPWVVVKTFQDTGSIIFNRDSSGYLCTTLSQISDNEEFFRWHHDTINETIDLSFINGTTTGFFENRANDTIIIHIRDYLHVKNRHSDFFYGIFIVR